MTDNDSTTRLFRDAEKAYWSSLGVSAEEHFVELKRLGITGRYLTVGEGPPVVLVHGGGGLGSGWAPLVPHLDGFRLYLLDRPGFGLTDFFDFKRGDFRDHAVSFMHDMYEAAGIEFASIIANSMGALWSLWFAQRQPERVCRLSLMGCPALILDSGAPAGMRLLGVPGLNRLMMRLEPPGPTQVRTLWSRLGHDPDSTCTPELIEMLVRLGQLPTYEAAWLGLLESVLPWSKVKPELQLSESELREIRHGVLYLWGRNDPFGSLDVAQRAQQATPNSEFHIVGTGHLPWIDDARTCATLTKKFFNLAL